MGQQSDQLASIAQFVGLYQSWHWVLGTAETLAGTLGDYTDSLDACGITRVWTRKVLLIRRYVDPDKCHADVISIAHNADLLVHSDTSLGMDFCRREWRLFFAWKFVRGANGSVSEFMPAYISNSLTLRETSIGK